MSERCHIKRPRPGSALAHRDDPALCGPDVGGVYVTLSRDAQIPETHFPVCTPCAARHIEERYEAIKLGRLKAAGQRPWN